MNNDREEKDIIKLITTLRIFILLTVLIVFGFGGKTVLAANNQVVIEADDYVKTDINNNITTANKNVRLSNEKVLIEADYLTYNGTTGIANATGNVRVTKDEATIVGDKLVYNNFIDLAEFSGGVKLTSKKGVIIEAAEITYDGKSGLAVASGGVKITQQQSVYETDTINYNLNDSQGISGPVKMQVGDGRHFKISGSKADINKDTTTINDASITRCTEPHPEYIIKATSATYEGQYVKLRNVVFYLGSIPIFYSPFLSLRTDWENFPIIVPGYNATDGFFLNYSYATHPENGNSLVASGLLKTITTPTNPSTIGFGVRTRKKNFSNYLSLVDNAYSNHSYVSIADTMSYDMPLLYLVVDGTRDLSSSEITKFGFSLTRKYWDSPVGKWQFGILARYVSLIDNSTKYGGTYGGYSLDYKPNPYMTFSLLQLESLAGENYQNYFLSDYLLGSNWFYNMSTPVFGKYYSFNIQGTYNSDQKGWIHRTYNIIKTTDCISLSLGWDDVPRSIVWGVNLRF